MLLETLRRLCIECCLFAVGLRVFVKFRSAVIDVPSSGVKSVLICGGAHENHMRLVFSVEHKSV